jgi:hypothetical protein
MYFVRDDIDTMNTAVHLFSETTFLQNEIGKVNPP